MPLKKAKHIVVVDPAQVSPEVPAYNCIARTFGELARNHAGFSLHGLHFVVPRLSGCSLKATLREIDAAGVICLGSYANVTDANHWVEELKLELQECVFAPGLPFLGICFAHQLLAHAFGGRVDFIENRHVLPLRKHHAFRAAELTHPKLALLLCKLEGLEAGFENRLDLTFRAAVRTSWHWDEARWQKVMFLPEWKLSQEEFRVRQFLQSEAIPRKFVAQGRHEQEVKTVGLGASLLGAATSAECSIDAMVHTSKPIYSVQTHPETLHSSRDGERLIRNFIYACDLTSNHW